MAKLWLASQASIVSQIEALPLKDTAKPGAVFRITCRALAEDGADVSAWPGSPMSFTASAGSASRRTRQTSPARRLHARRGAIGWQVDGFGMKHGLVRDGEVVVADEGGTCWRSCFPLVAGRMCGPRGSLGRYAVLYSTSNIRRQSQLVMRAANMPCSRSSWTIHSTASGLKFINQPLPGWLTAGGDVGQPDRRVYLELVTKSLNNYFRRAPATVA